MERRDFMKGVLAAASGGLFAGKVLGANDRIRIGQIGLGGRGKYEYEVCMQNPGCEIVAVADVYQPLVDLAVRRLGNKVSGYTDFRRILDRKDVDAVFISTPDHWHAIPSIMACQAGKDVYCEKPLSHTIEEGRRMVNAARKYNRVFQTGSQQRSAPHYRKIVELIHSGYIGKVAMVECWNMMNEYPEGQGNPPDSDPPSGLDWDMFLGPAPKRPYNRNRFIYTYRQFWDYAGSMMADWGAHHMDIVHWAMGVDAPKSAAAIGGKFVMQDDRETPDTFAGEFEIPALRLAIPTATQTRKPFLSVGTASPFTARWALLSWTAAATPSFRKCAPRYTTLPSIKLRASWADGKRPCRPRMQDLVRPPHGRSRVPADPCARLWRKPVFPLTPARRLPMCKIFLIASGPARNLLPMWR